MSAATDVSAYEARSRPAGDNARRRLRRRLADHGLKLIANQWGVGYSLAPKTG